MVNRREFVRSAATAGVLPALMTGMGVDAAEPAMSLNVLYPHHEGARFDLAYYKATHIPLAMRVMKATSVKLIEGMPNAAGAPPPFVMIAHFEFASPEALRAGVTDPGMADVRADIAKFTDIRQVVMVGRTG